MGGSNTLIVLFTTTEYQKDTHHYIGAASSKIITYESFFPLYSTTLP